MMRLQHTTTKWSQSFPTSVSAPISIFSCTYEGSTYESSTYEGKKFACKKSFSRQCDLRRHQKNHNRSAHCPKCACRFPSQKDLDHHENTIHNNTLKYFCPHAWCRDSIRIELDDWFVWGFRRKDHWLKHLRVEHGAIKNEVKLVQQAGIPMAALMDARWTVVPPKPIVSERAITGPPRAAGESLSPSITSSSITPERSND